jgi:hypothetical protein
MTDQPFTLWSFPSDRSLPDVSITGQIARSCQILRLSYELQGALAEVVIPVAAGPPSRKDELWTTTCFEFFLGLPESQRYWEFNLSPAGHWNVYRFDGYRQGMEAEPAFTALPFSVQAEPTRVHLDIEVNLDKIVPAAPPLKVAIAAVVQPTQGEVSYWALTHPGSQADFHKRRGFILRI